MTSTVDYETFVNWLLDNADKAMLARLCDMIEEAGEKANELVKANPLYGPYPIELIADDFYYRLRDKIGVTASVITDEAGVATYYAQRGDDNPTDGSKPSPRFAGETAMQAYARMLRAEIKADDLAEIHREMR